MAVGIIDHETGTRDIRKLGGLMTIMPITFTITLIGAFSMAGLPPFNGFLSKEMFFTSMLRITDFNLYNADTWSFVLPVLAWIGSVFTFIYCMVLLFKTFGGKYQPEKLEKQAHEAPLGMLISPIVLVSLVVIFFFFPNILSYSIIEPAASSIMPTLLDGDEKFKVHIYMWHGFSSELYMTIGVVALGVLAYLTLSKWRKVYGLFPEKLTLNKLYDSSLSGLEKGSNKITRTYMTGFLRDYLVYVLSSLS